MSYYVSLLLYTCIHNIRSIYYIPFCKYMKLLQHIQKIVLSLRCISEKESGNAEVQPARDREYQRRMELSEMVALSRYKTFFVANVLKKLASAPGG
jgi:hypothetical protein